LLRDPGLPEARMAAARNKNKTGATTQSKDERTELWGEGKGTTSSVVAEKNRAGDWKEMGKNEVTAGLEKRPRWEE